MNKKDKKSKNLIKKFLVAGAAISGLVTISGNAMGATYTTAGNVSTSGGGGIAAAAGDTLKFGNAAHVITVNNDLSGAAGINFDLDSKVGNLAVLIANGAGNDGKLRIGSISGHSVNRAVANRTLNISFANAGRELTLGGDLSNGQLGTIDFANNDATVAIENNAKLDLLDITSTGGAGVGEVNAKGSFTLKTRAFGTTAIKSFNLFTETAGSTGTIELDLTKANAGAAGDIVLANPIAFANNGDLTLIATGANNVVNFGGAVNVNDKTATITFKGSANNANAAHTAFNTVAANKLQNVKNATFVVDMDNAEAGVDFSAQDFSAPDTAPKKLEVKKGRAILGFNTKVQEILLSGEKDTSKVKLKTAGEYNFIISPDQNGGNGVVEIDENVSLNTNSTLFKQPLGGEAKAIYKLNFTANNKTLTLPKELNNVATTYISTNAADVTNGGTIAISGSTIFGTTDADSYIGYKATSATDNTPVVDNRIKAISFTTVIDDNQVMLFNEKKIRLGNFTNVAADTGIIADHAGKSSDWTFSADELRTNFNVATADSNVKITLNNQDGSGVTLAGTFGNQNAISELVIDTAKDVKLDNSTTAANGVAVGGNGNTKINTKKLTFKSDVNVIGSEETLLGGGGPGANGGNIESFSVQGTGLGAIQGGVILASSAAAGANNGTSITANLAKKLMDGKIARLGVTGDADATIATNANSAPGLVIADDVNMDLSRVKLVTLTNKKGKVTISGRAKLADIGEEALNFETVTFSGANDATYSCNVYSDSVSIAGNTNLVFTGNINNTKDLEITSTGSLTFSNKIGKIKTSAAELTFNGTDKAIGDLGTATAPIAQKVNFTNGSSTIGNVYANTINVKNHEFEISEAKTMHSATDATLEDATYTFVDSSSSLKLTSTTGANKYSKTLTLNLQRLDDKSQSWIELTDVKHMNLDSVNTVAINLDADYSDGADVGANDKPKSLVFIATPEGADTKNLLDKLSKTAKLIVKNSNRFQTYKMNGLAIESSNTPVKEAAENMYQDLKNDSKIDNKDADLVKAYIDSFTRISPTSGFAKSLYKIGKFGETANKNIVSLVKNTQDVAKDTYNVISSTTSLTSQIANSLGNRMAAVSAISASGDESPIASAGAYIQPFMSFANNSGDGNKYSLSGAGFTVGGDVGLNDNNTVLGVAYTFASNKLKFKESASATTNTSTNAFSIYATQNISSGAFVEGLFAYASTDVRANMSRISNLDGLGNFVYKEIKNDYNVKTMIGRALVGYNYNIDSFAVSPLVGAEFISSRTGDGALFKEKDIPVSTSIKSKNTVNPAILLGARFSTEIDSGDMKIIPTAGILMKFKLSDKDMEVTQTLDGLSGAYIYKKNKVSKFSVAPSVGVTMKQNQMEYSASYSADISEKYVGHNAGLKVKINF